MRLATSGGVYVPRFYDVDYLPDGRIQRVAPNRSGVPWRVHKHTVMDLDAVAVPQAAAGAAGRDGARADVRGDLPRLHPRLPVLPGRDDHPSGPGAVDHRHRRDGRERADAVRLRGGRAALAVQRRPLARSPTSPRAWPTGTRAPTSSLSLPSTRVDAFNIDLANELSRNGRRSGLTFAPEGGSERLRRVINKMVSEDDLIRTVTAAYAHGWRQVKLYFMCGLPTETDEDVLRDRRPGARRSSRPAARPPGTKDIRCTVSIGGFVPKPHTPFQWAAQLDHEATDAPAAAAAAGRDPTPTGSYGRAIGFRYHDGKPGIVEGLLSRGDRRVGRGDPRGLADGGRFDGWSEHFSYDRWVAAAERRWRTTGSTSTGTRTREREQSEVLPWDHLDSGLDKDWLWARLAGRARPRSRSTTAVGRPASTAGSARRWAPRSRSARPVGRCCRWRRSARRWRRVGERRNGPTWRTRRRSGAGALRGGGTRSGVVRAAGDRRRGRFAAVAASAGAGWPGWPRRPVPVGMVERGRLRADAGAGPGAVALGLPGQRVRPAGLALARGRHGAADRVAAYAPIRAVRPGRPGGRANARFRSTVAPDSGRPPACCSPISTPTAPVELSRTRAVEPVDDARPESGPGWATMILGRRCR